MRIGCPGEQIADVSGVGDNHEQKNEGTRISEIILATLPCRFAKEQGEAIVELEETLPFQRKHETWKRKPLISGGLTLSASHHRVDNIGS